MLPIILSQVLKDELLVASNKGHQQGSKTVKHERREAVKQLTELLDHGFT
jgi:hypothetical protein